MEKIKQILVVDDDEQILFVWESALQRYASRWAVETAQDGAEALRKLDEANYDLLVTDLRMPGMDGRQLTDVIRRRCCDIPVLWITSFPSLDNEALAQRLNVRRCLSKPLSVAEIRQVVVEVLGA